MAKLEHYLLRAYVCGRGCVRWQQDVGTSTYDAIFRRRPADCRYAVVEAATGEVVVFDLYASRFTGIAMARAREPEETQVYSTIDAAVMATALLYEA